MKQLVQIPFKGTNIIAQRDGDTVLLGIRAACASLGLDYSAQLKRLKRRSWATVAMMTTVAADGKLRETCFVDRRTFTMWLATIDTSRITNPAAREMLEAYQCEAADAIDAYFHEGAAITPAASEHQLNAVIRRAQMQAELAQACKGLIHPDHLEAKARVILATGMGERPEIEPGKRPLYTADYLHGKGLSDRRMRSVAPTFGKRVKKAYVAKYGREPMKYDLNLSNGQTRPVNAYIEDDRWLLDEVWEAHYGTGAQEVLAA